MGGQGGQNGRMMGGPNGMMNRPMMGPNDHGGPMMGGQQGMMGQQGNQGQMMGPNSDDMQKQQEEMQKRQEEMQKKQQEQQLKGMQQGVKGMQRPIKMVQSKIAGLEAKSIVVPDSLKTQVSGVAATIDKVLAATSADDAQDLMSTLAETFSPGPGGDPIQQWFQQLQALEQIPKVTKQLDQQIAQRKREADQLAKRAARSKLDLSSSIAEVTAAVADLEKARDEVKAALTNGDTEDMGQAMQPFFDQQDEVRQKMEALRAVVDLSQHLKGAQQQMSQDARTIASLKRKKLDTSGLQDLLNQMKDKLNEIKSLASQKPLDPDALMEAASGGEQLQQDFDQATNELLGTDESSQYFQANQQGVPQYKQMDFSQYKQNPSVGAPQGQGGF